MGDFVVESMGRCFICLNSIGGSEAVISVKKELGSDSVVSCPISSLQSLSRYLRIDMTKVFNSNDAVLPNLLGKVNKSRLKANLCPTCNSLNENLTKRIQQREKIELEIKADLKVLHGNLLKGDQFDESGPFPISNQFEYNSVAGLKGKMDILKALRAEARGRCLNKLISDIPRVKICKLSHQRIHDLAIKLQPDSTICHSGHYSGVHQPSTDKLQTSDIVDVDIKLETVSVTEMITEEDNVDCLDPSSVLVEESEEPNTREIGSVEIGSEETIPSRSKLPYTIIAPPNSYKQLANLKSIVISENGKHRCPKCGSQLANWNGFLKHFKGSHLNFKYRCKLCGNEFNDSSSFTRHYQGAHAGLTFTCQECNRRFNDRSNFISHLRNVHSSRKMRKVCNECGMKFKDEAHLNIHTRNDHFKPTGKELLSSNH